MGKKTFRIKRKEQPHAERHPGDYASPLRWQKAPQVPKRKTGKPKSFTPPNLHKRDKHGMTILHWYARKVPSGKIIRSLIEGGADVNAVDASGLTPLHHAARYTTSPSVIHALVDAGCRTGEVTQFGLTPLHYAARRNSLKIVGALLKRGADVNARANDGYTPLHGASRNPRADVMGALLKAGGDTEALMDGGLSPLGWALIYEDAHLCKETFRVLRKALGQNDDEFIKGEKNEKNALPEASGASKSTTGRVCQKNQAAQQTKGREKERRGS